MTQYISLDDEAGEMDIKEENQQQHLVAHDQRITFEGPKLRYNQFYSVELISNLADHQKYQTLLKLMYILEESLPNMKINQIHSYVFSSENEKLLLLRDGQLEGGVCFKTVPKRYSEIELFAVSREKRSKGNGSLLMNAFKSIWCLTQICFSAGNSVCQSPMPTTIPCSFTTNTVFQNRNTSTTPYGAINTSSFLTAPNCNASSSPM